MKRYVFVADDQGIPDFEDIHRTAIHAGFEQPLDYSLLESKRDELLVKARTLVNEGEYIYLITDADFHFENNREFGGATLGEEFLGIGGVNCRVVIRSAEPLLSKALENDPRVLAVKRTYRLTDLFFFLKTGRTPRIRECLDFLSHIDSINPLFSTFESASSANIQMVIDVLSQGFGAAIPEPFDSLTLDLFGSSVAGFFGQGFLVEDWKQVEKSFHPYEALRSATSTEFSPGVMPGSFLVLWFLCRARRGRSEIFAELQKSEERFAPREQEWIRRRRKALEANIRALYSDGGEIERWSQLLAGARKELKSIHRLLTECKEVG